ncbi:MAG: hypothetical protein RIE23_00075, partial [Pontimonas sp.]
MRAARSRNWTAPLRARGPELRRQNDLSPEFHPAIGRARASIDGLLLMGWQAGAGHALHLLARRSRMGSCRP